MDKRFAVLLAFFVATYCPVESIFGWLRSLLPGREYIVCFWVSSTLEILQRNCIIPEKKHHTLVANL